MEILETVLTSPTGDVRCDTMRLLEVRNLDVRISHANAKPMCVLTGIDFNIGPGEVVGLLGESGAGKTTLALALVGLLPPSFQVLRGSVHFEGRPLHTFRDADLRKIRGARISLIHQESTALNPVLRVGEQVVEVLRAHRRWTRQRCCDEARLLLDEVELGDIDQVYASYPHQLSGGQRQRIVIAQALACRPALVIADEPTSSLDAGTASAVVELLGRLKRRFNIAFLIVSHDIAVLAKLAERLMVMYAGQIVEQGPCQEILRRPLHPYTRSLLSCAIPARAVSDIAADKFPLSTISGEVAHRSQSSLLCGFQGRCPDRMAICARDAPNEVATGNGHTVSCFKFGASQ